MTPRGRRDQSDVAPTDVAAVLEQLAAPRQKFVLSVGGHSVAVRNLDKPLWPAARTGRGRQDLGRVLDAGNALARAG